jgi:quercetin 2,3-dioxygenase
MIVQSQAKIFLGDEHGLVETNSFRNRTLFSYGNNYNEHREPFEGFYLLNDYTLDAGASVQVSFSEDSFVLLLPVVGAVQYSNGKQKQQFVMAGQSMMLEKNEGDSIELRNIFEEELVNVLVLAFKAEADQLPSGFVYDYDVNEKPNDLVRAVSKRYELPATLSVGKFSGRAETVYNTEQPVANVFVFVLEGAFEVEGRLLHARDGLALSQTSSVEMEALSNDALIIVVEMESKL